MANSNSSLPLNNLSPTQREAFNTHLNDLWDDYQDQLADLITEAKTMVPNALYDEDGEAAARSLLDDYARQANIIANDYYRTVRDAWAEAAGIQLPGYEESQVTGDRALWQVAGGFNSTDFAGLKFTDVINGRSHAGLTIDDLWAMKTNGYKDDDWAALAKDIVNATTRLTTRFNVQKDPSRPRYARVPQGKTCAFCSMLASRGFVYASEDTAGKWHKYHKDCDCKIVPTWGETRIDGYDPEKLYDMYKTARDAAKKDGDASISNILSWMRADFPDMLKDGSDFAPDMRIPKGSLLEKQLGETYTIKVNKLLKDTEHKDTARLWAKYADRFDIKKTTLAKGAYFDPNKGGIYLNLETVMKGDTAHRPVQNLFHESGHMLDWLLDKNTFSWAPHAGKMFNDVLKRDAQRIYDTTQATLMAEGKPADRKSVMRAIAEEIARNSAKTDRNVEDMLQAALGDDYHGTVGHKKGYFQQSGELQSTEAFAEMLDAQMANPEAWRLIANYFPDSARMFNNMIQEALS